MSVEVAPAPGSETSPAVAPPAAGVEPESDGGVRVLIFNATDDVAGIEDAYHRISRELAPVPGMLGNELLRSMQDPRGFVVLSSWRSVADFQVWEQGADHRVTTAPLRPFRDTSAGRPFGVYRVTAAYAADGRGPGDRPVIDPVVSSGPTAADPAGGPAGGATGGATGRSGSGRDPRSPWRRMSSAVVAGLIALGTSMSGYPVPGPIRPGPTASGGPG